MVIGLAVLAFILGGIFLFVGYMEEITWSKFVGWVLVLAGVLLVSFYFTTASGQRTLKTLGSDTSGGIERTVEVYDQQGHLIKEYEGKLDVETNEYGNKVLFDLDGKRTIIYNATVIVQER